MTRRDFELIAATIRDSRSAAPEGSEHADTWFAGFRAAHTELAHDFADELVATNPRFDRERFLRACGAWFKP